MKTRRKAIDCKLVEASKTNPGYFKYLVTIEELDGTIHDVPAYGKDMQDAISRLVWHERVDKITNYKGIMMLFALLILGDISLSTYIAVVRDEPIWIGIGFGMCAIILVIVNYLNNYFKKGIK